MPLAPATVLDNPGPDTTGRVSNMKSQNPQINSASANHLPVVLDKNDPSNSSSLPTTNNMGSLSLSNRDTTIDTSPGNNHTKSRSTGQTTFGTPFAPDNKVSSTASQSHVHEQRMLQSFSVPNPPISTQQSTFAKNFAQKDPSSVIPPRTLWMGDIDPWLREPDIVYIWKSVLNKDVSVKFITPKGHTSSNFVLSAHSGYCFVEFPSYQDAQQALSLNGQLLPDIALPSQQGSSNDPDNQKKYFRLNWASGATLSAPIVDSPEFSLFVGDLSASTTEAHLLSFFQKSFPNSIRTVRVMADPVSGKSRCFGFVRFTTDAERQRALQQMNGVRFGGRPLRVALATPRASAADRYNPDFRGAFPGPRNGFPPIYGQIPGYYPPIMNNGSDTPGQMFGNLPLEAPNTTVFVGGISSEVSEKTLYTLFKPFGEILQVKIPPGKNCGFLKYTTRESAEKAIASMKGFIIGGNEVRLGWGRISSKNKNYMRQQMAQVQMHAAAVMSMGMDPSMFAANYSGPLPPQMSGVSSPYPQMTPPPNMMPFMSNLAGRRGSGEEEGEMGNEMPRIPGMGPMLPDYGTPSAYPYQMEPDQLIGTFENILLENRNQFQDLFQNGFQNSYENGQKGPNDQAGFKNGFQADFPNQFPNGFHDQFQGQFQGQFPGQFQNLPPMYAPYSMYPMQEVYDAGAGAEAGEPSEKELGNREKENSENKT